MWGEGGGRSGELRKGGAVLSRRLVEARLSVEGR